MALGAQSAHAQAGRIIEALAQSGQLQINGPNTTAGGSDVGDQAKRGEKDAAYLASLYRNLAKGLQEQ